MAITEAPMRGLVQQVRAARRLPTPTVARAIRAAVGVTQQQLAEELGVGRVTVARWESGTRTPRGELRSRYVELLEELRDAAGF
jgi:DNA-binding transcriptional regulator YiaG